MGIRGLRVFALQYFSRVGERHNRSAHKAHGVSARNDRHQGTAIHSVPAITPLASVAEYESVVQREDVSRVRPKLKLLVKKKPIQGYQYKKPKPS